MFAMPDYGVFRKKRLCYGMCSLQLPEGCHNTYSTVKVERVLHDEDTHQRTLFLMGTLSWPSTALTARIGPSSFTAFVHLFCLQILGILGDQVFRLLCT